MRMFTNKRTTRTEVDNVEPQWVSDVKTEITRRLGDKITVNELAKIAKMADWDLLKRFQNETGVALARYVHLSRLKSALGLLHASDLPLAEIAHTAGFGSLKHMTSVFRTELGTLPGELRRIAQCIRAETITEEFNISILGIRNSTEPEVYRACGAL